MVGVYSWGAYEDVKAIEYNVLVTILFEGGFVLSGRGSYVSAVAFRKLSSIRSVGMGLWDRTVG